MRAIPRPVSIALILTACASSSDGEDDTSATDVEETLGETEVVSTSSDAATEVDEDVTTPDTSDPTVRFIEPLDGSTVNGLVDVALAVTDDRGVARVTLSSGGQELVTLDHEPWSWSWDARDLLPGPYELTATAFDGAGNSASRSIRVNVSSACSADGDCPPSSVRIITPVDAARVCGTVTIEAAATDDIGLDRIEFEIDGLPLGVAEAAPYAYDWNTTDESEGLHAIRAVAYDITGQAAFDAVVVEVRNDGGDCDNLPNVRITTPAPGAFVHGAVDVRAEASDDEGVTGVRFFVDNGLIVHDETIPYYFSWDTSEFDDGVHTLKAMAQDVGSQTAEAQVTITVDRTPPDIVLVAPQGDSFDDVVLFMATASDNFLVDRVELYLEEDVSIAVDPDTGMVEQLDGEPVAVASMAPYEVEWDAGDLASGTHGIIAVAFDGGGLAAVDRGTFELDRPPALSISAPEEGAVVMGQVGLAFVLHDDSESLTLTFLVDGEEVATDVVYEVLGDIDLVDTLTWTPPYARGSHTLMLRATDDREHVVEASVSVLVDHPLEVTLQRCDPLCSAISGEPEVSETVDLQAVTRDDDGATTRLEFFVEGVLVGVDATPPFTQAWDSTLSADGLRALRAVATSDSGAKAETIAYVTVNNCDRDGDTFTASACGGPDCDDLDETFVQDACGGCEALPADPGARCETCGIYRCVGTALVCERDGTCDGGPCGSDEECLSGFCHESVCRPLPTGEGCAPFRVETPEPWLSPVQVSGNTTGSDDDSGVASDVCDGGNYAFGGGLPDESWALVAPTAGRYLITATTPADLGIYVHDGCAADGARCRGALPSPDQGGRLQPILAAGDEIFVTVDTGPDYFEPAMTGAYSITFEAPIEVATGDTCADPHELVAGAGGTLVGEGDISDTGAMFDDYSALTCSWWSLGAGAADEVWHFEAPAAGDWAVTVTPKGAGQLILYAFGSGVCTGECSDFVDDGYGGDPETMKLRGLLAGDERWLVVDAWDGDRYTIEVAPIDPCDECAANELCVAGRCERFYQAEDYVIDAGTGLHWHVGPTGQTMDEAAAYCAARGLYLPPLETLRGLIMGCPGTEPGGGCHREEHPWGDRPGYAAGPCSCAFKQGQADGGCYIHEAFGVDACMAVIWSSQLERDIDQTWLFSNVWVINSYRGGVGVTGRNGTKFGVSERITPSMTLCVGGGGMDDDRDGWADAGLGGSDLCDATVPPADPAACTGSTCDHAASCGEGVCQAGECCLPSCAGRECGEDGCGGSCGPACGAGEVCDDFGRCRYTGVCGELGLAGCCARGTGYFCMGSELFALECEAPNPCGWDASVGLYTCGGDGADPSGREPFDCDAAGYCAPDCAGRECGDDACGGSCGTCLDGMTCSADGRCESGVACGALSDVGCCDGTYAYRCRDDQVWFEDCAMTLGTCGWDYGSPGSYRCDYYSEAEDPNGVHPRSCDTLGVCVPRCDDRQCGDDGCGGSCGSCAPGEPCSNGRCGVRGCGDLGPIGCCDGGVLHWCDADLVVVYDCALSEIPTCGWVEGYYNCGGDESDPDGVYPRDCAEYAFEPPTQVLGEGCANPRPLTAGPDGTFSGSGTLAPPRTDDVRASACDQLGELAADGVGTPDESWTFTAPSEGIFEIEVAPVEGVDLFFMVFETSGCPWACYGYLDNAYEGGLESIALGLSATDYTIVVDTYDPAFAGAYTIAVRPAAD